MEELKHNSVDKAFTQLSQVCHVVIPRLTPSDIAYYTKKSTMVQNYEIPLKSEELEIYDVHVSDDFSSKKDHELIECSTNSNSPIMETAYGDVVFVDVNDPEFGLDSEFIIDDNTSSRDMTEDDNVNSENIIEEILIEDSESDIIVIDDNEPSLETNIKENAHSSFGISNENISGHQKWKENGLFGLYKDGEGFSKDIATVSEEPQEIRQKLENQIKINDIKTNDMKIENNHSNTSNIASKPGFQNKYKVIKPLETLEHTNFLKIMNTFSLKVKDDNIYVERKKRGRPPKPLLGTNETNNSNSEVSIQNQNTVPLKETNTSKVQLDEDTIIQKRGRPSTLYTGANLDQELRNHHLQLKHNINRKRGRPPKLYTGINNNTTSDIVVQNQNTQPLGKEIQKEQLIVKKRGRPMKVLPSSTFGENSDEILHQSQNFLSSKEDSNNTQPCQEPKKAGRPWKMLQSINIGADSGESKNSNSSKKDNIIQMQEPNIKKNKTSCKTAQFVTSDDSDEIKHQNISYSKDGSDSILVAQETSVIKEVGKSRKTSSENRPTDNEIEPQILKDLLVKEKNSLPQQTSVIRKVGKPEKNLPGIDTDNKNLLRSKNSSESVNLNVHTPQFVKRKAGRPWKYIKETGTIHNPEVVCKGEKQRDNLLDSRLVNDSHKVMHPITENLTISDIHEKVHSKSKPKLIMKVSRSWKVENATNKTLLKNQVNDNNGPQEMIRKYNENKEILNDSKQVENHNDRIFDSEKNQSLDSANNVSIKRGPGRPRKLSETIKPREESNINKKLENRLTNHESKWPRQSKTNQQTNKSRRKYNKHKMLFWKTRKTYQQNKNRDSFPNFEAGEVFQNQQTLKLNKPADEKLSNTCVQNKLKRKYQKHKMLFWKTRKTYKEKADNVSDLESSNNIETVGHQQILKLNEPTGVKLSPDQKILKRKYEKSKMLFCKTRKIHENKTNTDLLERKEIVKEKPFDSETNYNSDDHSEMKRTGHSNVLTNIESNKIMKQNQNHENYNPLQENKSEQNLPQCQAAEDNLKVQQKRRRGRPKKVRDNTTVQSNTNVQIISNERMKRRKMRRDLNLTNFTDLDPDLKLKYPKFDEVGIPLVQEILDSNSSVSEVSENITDSIKSSNSLSLPKSVSPSFCFVDEQNINSANNKIMNHLEPTNCEILNVEIICVNRNKNGIENNVAKVSQVQSPASPKACNQELQNTYSDIVTASEPILKTVYVRKEPSGDIVDDVNNHNKHCVTKENEISIENLSKPVESIIQPQLEVDYLNNSVPRITPLETSSLSSLLEPTYENYSTDRQVLNNKLINHNFTPTISSYNQQEAEIITGDDDTFAFDDCNVQYSQNPPNFPIIPERSKLNTLNNYMPQLTAMHSINNFRSNYSSNKTIVERHSAFYEQVQNPSLYTSNQNKSATLYQNPVRMSKELYQTNISTVSVPTQNEQPSVSLELMFNNQSQKITPPTLTGMDKELYDKLDVCFNEVIELQIRDISCLIFKMLANKMSIRNLEFSMRTDTRNAHHFIEALSAEKKKTHLIGTRFTILFDSIIKSNPAFETSDLIYVLFYKIMETLVKKDQAMPFIFIIKFYIGQMLRHNNYTNINVLEVLLSSKTEFKFCYRTIQKRLEYYKQYNQNNFLTSESICSSVDNLLKTVEQSSFAMVPNLKQFTHNSTPSEQNLPYNELTSEQKTPEKSYQNTSTNKYLQNTSNENQKKIDFNKPTHSYHVSHSICPPCTNSAVPNINVNISVNNPFTNTRNDYVETVNKSQMLSKSSENNKKGKEQNILLGNFLEQLITSDLDDTNIDKSQNRNDKSEFETLRAAVTNLK